MSRSGTGISEPVPGTETDNGLPVKQGPPTLNSAASVTDVRRKAKRPIDSAYLLMLVPAVVLFSVFLVLPAAIGVFFSVTNYAGYGDWEFVGFGNYIAMFDDPAILQSYLFTFFLAAVAVVVVNVAAMAIAIGLNSKIKWRSGIRTVFFIPMVLSAIIVAYVFNYLFSTSIPTIADSLGLTPFASSILASEQWSWVAIVFVTAWQAIPSATIIYLAGLQSVPSEIYEAAYLDGAGMWQRFRKLTLPLIVGYVVINVILGFKGFLGSYEIVLALTNGGPGTATTTVAMRIFDGFNGGEYAYQMANSVVFFVITVTISLLQIRFLQRKGMSL
ncbi:MAG: carbohydrate ABC transporter permease [Rhodococcus sp. (in: high G+C Gram-positive bacteria)]